MTDFLKRFLRIAAFGLVALIGLGMALIFTFSTLIAVAILFFAAKLRGQRFSVQEYWTNRQARRKPIFTKGSFSNNSHPPSGYSRDDVTDVQARDVR
jgi:predicted RND superfamily exporter protein